MSEHTELRRAALDGEAVVQRVIDLWNKGDGWIPGAAYKELAEALGVEVDRLVHYTGGKRHVPLGVEQTIDASKVKPGDIVVVDNKRVAWVRHTGEFIVTIGYDDGTTRSPAKNGGLVTVKRGVSER